MKPNATCVIVSGHTLTAADDVGDPDALADIREADKAYARGDVIRRIEAVRRLRP